MPNTDRTARAVQRRAARAMPTAKGIKLRFNTKVRDFARKGPSAGQYYAYQTASGKAPDFGKGQGGPGIPYREQLKNYKLEPVPSGPRAIKPPKIKNPKEDAKVAAIRRRLSGGK